MKHILTLAILLVLASCKDAKKSDMAPIEETSKTEVTQKKKDHLGKKIMETECYLCHNPKASQASMIAPPMIAVKKHYIDSSTTKKEFTESLVLWVNDPEAPSKMPGAQKIFGSMPYVPYPVKTITQIAEYMYDYEIERPKWFDAHFEAEHVNDKGKGKGKYKGMASHHDARTDYIDIGLGYALATKAQLGKNLIKAINEKGTVGAIEFCNTEAIKLTDSISVMKNAVVKRVSDKPRNPDNEASQEESEYINYFKKAVASDGEVQPIVLKENGEVNFYYPITTNTMCLQCHGKPNEQIRPEILTTLKNLYPADKAVGYEINEVRGIWAINFEEESVE